MHPRSRWACKGGGLGLQWRFQVNPSGDSSHTGSETPDAANEVLKVVPHYAE